MASLQQMQELNCSETPPGFHASLGRVKPCTLELRKMRDFVPVRTCLGEFPAAGDAVAKRLLGGVKPLPPSIGTKSCILILDTGCRGHPCPRKCETRGGFH